MTARAWPAIDGNLHFLRQGISLLGRLDDAAYVAPLRQHSPIGAQYRHVLEHYQSLLGGLASGRVDYDARARDPFIEQDRRHALRITRELVAAIQALPPSADRPIEVHMDSGGDSGPDWRASSLGRELQFLASHTVHHYALIALLLEGMGEEVPADFGVAPSTLTHQRSGH